MRFEVPQFIEVEDKIVGPLTWKQFIYLAGGGGLLIILYVLLPFIFFAMIGLPLGALAGFLAFHRINNRPFSLFLESFFTYMRPSSFWKKEAQTITGYTEESMGSPVKHMPDGTKLSSLAEKLHYYSEDQNS